MTAAPELTLLDVVDEIADLVEPAVLPQLRRFFARSTVAIETGAWDEQLVERFQGAFGLVVLDGVLVRECTIDGRHCTELLVAGDVAAPWVAPATALPVEVSWRVAQTVRVAVLDRTFLAATTRWPGLTACLSARYAETCARLAMHKSICQLPRVEDRVTLLLWHLSERIGRVSPGAMVVPLALTHAELGHLVGSQRSTVTLALAELARRGVVDRRGDGVFLLRGDPPGHLGAAPARQRRTRPTPWPQPAPAVARSSARLLPTPEFERLRARVGELGQRHTEAAQRVATELERARAARARSIELRARVQADRDRAAIGGRSA
jgi:hypothetical protein